MPESQARSRRLPALLALGAISLAGSHYVNAGAAQDAAAAHNAATEHHAAAAQSTAPIVSPATPAAGTVLNALNTYCVTCHNSRLKTAGLQLDALDVNRVADHAPQWDDSRDKRVDGQRNVRYQTLAGRIRRGSPPHRADFRADTVVDGSPPRAERRPPAGPGARSGCTGRTSTPGGSIKTGRSGPVTRPVATREWRRPRGPRCRHRPRVRAHDRRVAMHGALQHPGHGRAQVVVPRQDVTHPQRHGQHPLPHRYVWPHVVDEMGGALGHAAPATGGTEPASLARKGHEPLLTAAGAPKPGEPTREPATAKKGAELRVNESRQSLPVAQAGGLGTERFVVVAHDLIQHRRGGVARAYAPEGTAMGPSGSERRAGSTVAGFRSRSRTTPRELAIRAYARPGQIRQALPTHGSPRAGARDGLCSARVDAFAGALTRDLPPLAVVDSVTTRELARRRGRLPHRGQRRGRGPPHVHPAGRDL